jgi:catechol 2,3-dioxygenase-like lactoylglutathione lyase family enzyme
MIDHVSVEVADLDRGTKFYEGVLAPLGMTKLVVRPTTIGFGKTYPEFWINLRAGMKPIPLESGTHICLRAPTTAAIEAFHTAALKAGGQSNGAPGPRPEYHPSYYATFIVDPDGNRIEAVMFLTNKPD